VLGTVLAVGDHQPFAIDDVTLEAFAGIRTAGLTDVAEGQDETAEGFAWTVGLTIPTELQAKMKADGRPLLERFRELAPQRDPVSIQRWSVRRLALTGTTFLGIIVGIGLFVDAVRAGIE
jgi:hypothetical protein